MTVEDMVRNLCRGLAQFLLNIAVGCYFYGHGTPFFKVVNFYFGFAALLVHVGYVAISSHKVKP